ncbi:HD domain-containing protein [Pseudalkalibacillus caeni]|uniref:Bifunctional (P)ppGpp synthetase/guanosine-3',5'-bis(Diphosphate) 3'-pyrophosphohydrolase n=1 Tax=Exobacillus caeni TaxID=2574798 RepID=A0A5R9F7F3_9BACL|nr:HD domain-containing protein [Pseudalkalibacillus caeni]TLS38961.1 bifunctional (p)ppGpp synthetase/guanosine-3',5'-bis(diphosphate) 3'-pyrophosphohydrolase [Pseudalkalibacillus caeni]
MIIEKAIQIASKAHDGQYRKVTDIPYISHPFTVGMYLLKAGCDDEVAAAGILHDVVEDTEFTLEQIEELFGKRVSSIVEGCSEPDKSLPWEERKIHTINYLKTASLEVKLVACADKLHNLQTIYEDYQELGEKVWEKFNRGRDMQEWYYRGVSLSLSENLSGSGRDHSLFSKLQELVVTFFR